MEKTEYGEIFAFLDFCPHLIFIIENEEFNENKFIIRNVFSWQLFSDSLVIVKHALMNSRCTFSLCDTLSTV